MPDTNDPRNPLLVARTERGLSRRDLSIKLGLGYYSIAQAELGNLAGIPESWRPGIESALGAGQYELIRDAYKAWRAAGAPKAAAS